MWNFVTMTKRILAPAFVLLLASWACKKETKTILPEVIDYNITAAKTLKNRIEDPTQVDYLVKKTDWQILESLTIEPGVVIAFESNCGMNIRYSGNGYVNSKGTAEKPIRFTGNTAQAGFWKGILVGSADTRNVFDFCIVEYGGGAALISGMPLSNIAVTNTSNNHGKITITNSKIRNSAGYGMSMALGSELIAFSNNTFSQNTTAALQLPPSEVAQIDNLSVFATANETNAVEILGEDLNELTEQTWKKLNGNTQYKVIGNITLRSGLVIEAGASFSMSAASMIRVLFPSGYLIALGNSTNKISFQGYTNTKGFWKGILFNSSDLRNELSFCNIMDGGSSALISGLSNANIGVFTQSGNIGKAKINNCTISNSNGCGISKDASSILTESSNTFSGNTSNDICN